MQHRRVAAVALIFAVVAQTVTPPMPRTAVSDLRLLSDHSQQTAPSQLSQLQLTDVLMRMVELRPLSLAPSTICICLERPWRRAICLRAICLPYAHTLATLHILLRL
jgi:hypothetical protein